MNDYDYCDQNIYGKTKAKKPLNIRKPENGQEEAPQNGIGKSVFGRLFRDFRSGQNKEPKPQRPLSRTLSANYKDKDRKKKLSRTLSASQKDRKIVERRHGEEEDEAGDWASDIFQPQFGKSFKNGQFNILLENSWTVDPKRWKRTFSGSIPERSLGPKLEKSEINHSARVSYLDEEGLKKTSNDDIQIERISEDNQTRHATNKQDGTIMPTSSLRKKSTGTNHYENHNSFLLNELNKGKNSRKNWKSSESDYSCINYSAYKTETGKTSFNYYNDHRYENLETTDYISWSSEKDDTFTCGLEEERHCDSTKDEHTGKVGEELASDTLECEFLYGSAGVDWCRGQDVPDAPTRDPATLTSIKYGPGHEKYPSWPGSVRPETGDKPQRSHSWTEKTNYPKEKVTSYARPYNKRTNPTFTQQLKTVMERCEKITPESYQKTMEQVEGREKRIFLPHLDREGNSLGDQEYMVPSPPERDQPSLTQADLDKYYQDSHLTKLDNGDYSSPYDDVRKQPSLTQADLEEYTRSYDDVLKPLHQHQGSYAQSEGYHSYVSSSELTTTPFLDRLRRDSDSGIRSQHWSEEENRAGRDSVVTTSSGSASSSETLKWHGSMSDVSIASSSCRSRQLIAHSSRVPPPQRHHSESVLYLGNQSGNNNWPSKGDRSQQLKLFPVNTYTVQPNEQSKPVISPTSAPKMSVAERISELERQQQAQRFAYFDPEKRHKVSDPTLKAIQKKALLSFYERHQHGTPAGSTSTGLSFPLKLPDKWKLGSPPVQSGPQEVPQRNAAPPPPPPPPRPITSRRASCASDMGLSSWSKTNHSNHSNHSYTCSLVGPAIIGPSISVDDWVPELPPKKPHLRTIPPPLPQRSPSPNQVPSGDSAVDSLPRHKSLTSFNRMPTPELPLPPPPPAVEDEVVAFDEPLPPPPPEVEWHLATAVPIRSTPMSSGRTSPQSPVGCLSVKDCSNLDTTGVVEQNDSIRCLLVPDAYEIQYDQNAINAIMESNRLAELQKKKYSSRSKHGTGKDADEKSPLKVHIENRPPLPLPREVQLAREKKYEGCDRGTWQKSKENQPDVKIPFARSFSKPENSTRASVKGPKNDTRSSLRYASKKAVTANGQAKGRQSPDLCMSSTKSQMKAKSGIEYPKLLTVKKVSEYECRIPNRDRDGLTVFDTTAIDESKQTTEKFSSLHSAKGSNSKAAFLALRREKEMGMTNCEGSYKLTVSPCGERIETANNEKFPLEMMKVKEKSTENLVLDNRLTLEPPDLIPKISNLNRKSSSAQDIRNNRKKYDYNHFNSEKYRLIPTSGSNGSGRLGLFSDNIMQNECKVTFGVGANDEKAKNGFDSERLPVTTVECVRAVITKLETESPERLEQIKDNNVYQSKDEEEFLDKKKTSVATGVEADDTGKYGVSISLSRTEPEVVSSEKTPSLLRVRSNVEKRLSRSDSIKSNEGKIERSKSLKLVERSTSFGRSDAVQVVGTVEKSDDRNLNLSVSDASSQTDLLEEDPVHQQKLEEELECERLSRDLASQLSPSDKLLGLLVPDSERKKPTDYVAGLFRLELSSKPRRHQVKAVKKSELTTGSFPSQEVVINGVTSNQNEIVNGRLSPSFLNSTDYVGNAPSSKYSEKSDSRQIQKKKEELMARLDKKLLVLKEEQEALTNESTANEELGQVVANTVAKSTRPHDLAKYRLHVEEVGKITSLLLGLSGRLAKAENALLGLPESHDDRKTHECKRDKLQEQLAEAKQLKENIDRRSDSVAKTLGKYLKPEEFADYIQFIRMKAKLIVDLREIGDKISLGEEQLAALRETLSS